MFSHQSLVHWENIVIEGLGVALFAWAFDFTRKSILGGSAKAVKALGHGWTSFRLAAIDLDILRTEGAIRNPYGTLANMLVALTIALAGLMSLLASMLLDFVHTYYPLRGNFTYLYSPSFVPDIMLSLLSVAVSAMGASVARLELRRLSEPEQRLALLEQRKQKLLGAGDAKR